jgi:hypothetical protein
MGPVVNSSRFSLILRIAAAVSLFPALSAALDVSFVVTDKLGKPISGAMLCLEEDGSQCAETNASGKSTFSPTVGNRNLPATEGFSFSVRGGRISIQSPVSQPARVARFDARGRALGAELFVRLKPGSNGVEFGDAPQGLIFFRVAIPGHTYTGKALALSGSSPSRSGDGGTGSPAPRVAALGKVAAANLHAVIISKSGYRSVTYRPKTDHDTGVVIRLAAETDQGIAYAGIIRAKLISLDTAKHTVYYTYTETGCKGDTGVTAERNSTLPFYTMNNKWYFPAGNCKGVALGKEGDGPYGAWKTLGLQDYPPGLVPVACDPAKDSVVTSVVNLFFLNEGGGWDIDLSQDSLILKIRRELCPGNQAVLDPAYYDGKNGRPLLTRNTCREVEFRNPSDEPGTYSFVTQSDSLRGVFTYKDKSCPTPAVSLTISTNTPKKCPETQPTALASDTTFQKCVAGSGFMPQVQ